MEKKMGFFEAVSQVIRKSFVFKGRARRKEYWSWVLFSFLSVIVFFPVLIVLAGSSPESALWAPALMFLFGLLMFFPSLSVVFRRLHDVGRSGWWYGGYYLVSLVVSAIMFASTASLAVTGLGNPESLNSGALIGGGIFMMIYGLAAFVYAIVMLVWLFTEGTQGPNKYGNDPKRD